MLYMFLKMNNTRVFMKRQYYLVENIGMVRLRFNLKMGPKVIPTALI